MGRRLKIVVADDERDTREYFQEYLTHLGHEVQVAEDGLRLVEVCREWSPDLVVTDYAMPGLDGWTAAREVNRSRPVPVILFSGRHDVAALAQGEGNPVIRVLIKPIKSADLRAAVELVSAAAVPAHAPPGR